MKAKGGVGMAFRNREVPKRLLSFGLFVIFTVLAFLLEQKGIWGGLQLLLGLGAILAFYLGWGKGVVLNLPKALVFSLFAVILFYLFLDLVFPGTFARRLGDMAVEPYAIGVVLALLLFRPGRVSSV
ncbi:MULTISPECIES: hypothetical protein [Thermus]|jgi:hypothetical protein|uniref:Uncharacterized protein n=1 Tax=Thermus scotoductus TaxID=37636 RepID=A0A430QXD2_THESC|nr:MULTISPECIES: hypothetical protein [Thermus]RTG99794.1 hypothetical protein CSW50_11830 [Thermus scotoductus]RTH28342.1 hypothetical protein CSW40_01175 [Thermus scotoductus]RTI39906.1 hypothetical protein CSW18_06400 [Thermus scotoductus]